MRQPVSPVNLIKKKKEIKSPNRRAENPPIHNLTAYHVMSNSTLPAACQAQQSTMLNPSRNDKTPIQSTLDKGTTHGDNYFLEAPKFVLTFLFVPASLESVSLSSPPALAARTAATPDAFEAIVFFAFLAVAALPAAVVDVGVGAPESPPLSLKEVDSGVGAREPGVEWVVDAGVWASCFIFIISKVSPALFPLAFYRV